MTSHPKLRLLGLPALTHRALELRVTLTPSAYIACVQRFLTVTGKEAISYAVQIALVLSLEPAFKCLIDQSHLLFGPSISQWLVLCSHSKTGLQVQLILCFQGTWGPSQHHPVKSVNNSRQEWLRTECSWPWGHPAPRQDVLSHPFSQTFWLNWSCFRRPY